MRLLRSLFFCLCFLIYPLLSPAQYLFKEKITDVKIPNFCINCGTPQAQCDPEMFTRIIHIINRRYNLVTAYGSLTFQILVDSAGIANVISYNDASHSALSTEIITYLNAFRWKPALAEGKPVNSSVNVTFTLGDGTLTGKVVENDLMDFGDNTIINGSALVFNKQYPYLNQSLKNYTFKVWNRSNSLLPDDFSECNGMDRFNMLWYATGHGLITFDGTNFKNVPQVTTAGVNTLAIAADNVKWMYSGKAVYMYSASGWQRFDLPKLGFTSVNCITATASGEVLFSSDKGLLIVKNGQFTLIDQRRVSELPSNKINYAYYDKRGRLWVGTANGSILIDKYQKTTSFNGLPTPLNNNCITAATEDDKGNVYFALKAVNLYAKAADGTDSLGVETDAEGIAIYTADGKWQHYNDKNSGMPSNQVNSLLYDKFEKVLWIGTRRSGLVRMDVSNHTWENYHNNNSPVPSYDIYQMSQDMNGTLYLSTYKGLLVISKKH